MATSLLKSDVANVIRNVVNCTGSGPPEVYEAIQISMDKINRPSALVIWAASSSLTSGLSRDHRFIMDSDSISCDFELGTCGYIEDRLDNFDWIRERGTTPTYGTGPDVDHTYGNFSGHYMYTESSSPRRYGDVARLESTTGHTDKGHYSAEFYYSMHGATMGTLNVYVDVGNGSQHPQFTATGDKGTDWNLGCVDIPPNNAFKVVFESVLGYSSSDMAIDDVRLQRGTCASLTTTTPSAITCIDDPICPALQTNVANLCSVPSLAWKCNQTCLCSGGNKPSTHAPTMSTSASNCQDDAICPDLIANAPNFCSVPSLATQCNGTCLCGGLVTHSTTPTTTTTVKITTSQIYHFPNGSVCDDAPSCPFIQSIPNFCSEATLMVSCLKTCGLCALYSGSATGTVQDACTANKCQHGQCQLHARGYVCMCDVGYMGALCEHRNPCYNQPCVHGQCEVLTSTGYQCKCDLGFSGLSCNVSLVRDCQDILDHSILSHTGDDVYLIDIKQTGMPSGKLNVKCEFSNTIGWTVTMARESGQLDFDNKGSVDYAVGFGDTRHDFWTGLEYLHAMTSDGRRYQLRIDLTVANGSRYYQVYNDFSVGPHTKFQLNIGSSFGNAGDSLSAHNSFGFTTKDLDQDSNSAQNCASYISGGWWFHNCADSCLTCNYITPGTKDCRSMSWQTLGYCTALKSVSMKIRPM